jgi:hypothetical protein
LVQAFFLHKHFFQIKNQPAAVLPFAAIHVAVTRTVGLYGVVYHALLCLGLIENTIEQYKVGSVHLILAKILVCLDFDVV